MKCHPVLIISMIIAMILISGCSSNPAKSPNEQTTQPASLSTTIAAPVTTPTTVPTTTLPTPTPEPYPTALKIKQVFNFSSGKTASEGTVYRFWINDTYQLFDPRETRYVTKYPPPGKNISSFLSTSSIRELPASFPPRHRISLSGIMTGYIIGIRPMSCQKLSRILMHPRKLSGSVR